MINIRAWDYHAGLRYHGVISDFGFESLQAPPEYHTDVPRVALLPGKYQDFEKACRIGLRAHLPRRDSGARAPRDDRVRPRIRLIVANPKTLNRARANIQERAQGFSLIHFRAVVKFQEVRAAGTPSYYPNYIVFPKL